MSEFSFISTLKPMDASRRWDWHQRSALFSWSKMKDSQIIICGVDDEAGEALVRSYGYPAISEVQRAFDIGYKTQAPILTDLLNQGIERAHGDWVGLINSDIIVTPEFESEIRQTFDKIDLSKNPDPFITVRRRDFIMNETVEDDAALSRLEKAPYDIHPSTGSDLFLATKNFWQTLLKTMPAFITGRFTWDTYFHKKALFESSLAVEATDTIRIYHPFHGRNYLDPTNPEVFYNLALYEVIEGPEIYTLDEKGWLRI